MMLNKQATFALSLLGFFACIAWMGRQGSIGEAGPPMIVVFLAAHLCLALIWHAWPFKSRSVLTMLALALTARALMFPFCVSDDVNRYAWEGKIQQAGFNPYRLAPNDPELADLRDENWEGINHKDYPTVYPPAAQLLFRFCHWVWPDKRCLRLIFTLFDLGLAAILFMLAARFKIERRHVLLYALNPLVLLYVAGEGHLDPIPIFFLFAALWAFKTGREGRAFLFLGLGAMFKILPLAFFPFFVRRNNVKKAAIFFVPFLLAIPYLQEGVNLFSIPFVFAQTFHYNGLLYSLFSPLLDHPVLAQNLCWLCFSIAAVAVFFLTPDPLRSAYLLSGAWLICSPIMHQWYFLLIVPFLPFFRSPAWWMLTAFTSATFVTRFHQYATGGWIDDPLARCIEYGPFVLAGLWLFVTGRRHGPEQYEPPRSVSVVIPTLNEADEIEGCIRSIAPPSECPLDIIVVDGGSTDTSCEKVHAMPGAPRLVHTATGRGVQIAAGVKEAKGDTVLILHADSRLKPGAVDRMIEKLRAWPQAAGGAFGTVYSERKSRYALIALLDSLRARWFGVGFGNQAQFFRKAALKDGFPAYRLMEDVELSFRMKEAGSVLYIPRGVANKARRWKAEGYLRNMRIVIQLTAWFIFLRRIGLIRGDCGAFYRNYYRTT